ncbi:sugar MFS transporter [Bacteroidales bacterium]
MKSHPTAASKNNLVPLLVIGVLYFVFGFVTWINGALIPILKTACQLNDFMSYFVTFAFYISYFVMALPSSWILQKIGFRNGMVFGLLAMMVGALIFIPAALDRSYVIFLLGLFTIGTGLALLQTAVNPYVTILGPIESAAKRISIMGIANKFAGVLAPVILASVVLKNAEELNEKLAATADPTLHAQLLDQLSHRLIFPYLLMAGFLAALAIFIRFTHLPEIEASDDKEVAADSKADRKTVFSFPHLIFGVVALFFYVGVEVIAGDTIIRYGESLGVAMGSAKFFTSLMLVFMVMGYFIGVALIPKYLSQKGALIICSLAGIAFSLLAILIPAQHQFTLPFLDFMTFQAISLTLPYTVLFVALLGLSNSLIWPAIWPLALQGIGRFTKTASAMLIMAIAGGAVIPLLYGFLAGKGSTQSAYWIAIPCYLVVLAFALLVNRLRNHNSVKV